MCAPVAGEFDVVLVDPPYVSEECVDAFAAAARQLARAPITRAKTHGTALTPCLFITSEVMRGALMRALPGMRMTAFQLRFQSKLMTPLRVYTNVGDEATAANLGGWAADFDLEPIHEQGARSSRA